MKTASVWLSIKETCKQKLEEEDKEDEEGEEEEEYGDEEGALINISALTTGTEEHKGAVKHQRDITTLFLSPPKVMRWCVATRVCCGEIQLTTLTTDATTSTFPVASIFFLFFNILVLSLLPLLLSSSFFASSERSHLLLPFSSLSPPLISSSPLPLSYCCSCFPLSWSWKGDKTV